MDQRAEIFRSLAWMEERIEENLTVEALAGSIPLSKYHYQRIFREAVGDSVMSYVTRRRLFLAARELTETKASVLEIALKYGYGSHEGFSRSFKAHMGVTPTEYRKYQLFAASSAPKKERCRMYSKTTEEILKELNRIIVQAKETAAFSRKLGGKEKKPEQDLPQNYVRLWEFMAEKTEETADRLARNLERVTAIEQRPDEIEARFLLIKTVEDAAFQFSMIAFQTGLTAARALPDYQPVLQPLCEAYRSLAHTARIGSAQIVAFFQELVALIFRDMREQAEKKREAAVLAGKKAVESLSDPKLPYGYLAEEITEITERLESLPLEEITVYFLEEQVFRADVMRLAAETDMLRAPSHTPFFAGLLEWKQRLEELTAFFKELPAGGLEAFAQEARKAQEASKFQETAEDGGKQTQRIGKDITEQAWSERKDIIRQARGAAKKYHDIALQERILLFYLKGEISKLSALPLTEGQRVALAAVCEGLEKGIGLAEEAAGRIREKEADRIRESQVEEEKIAERIRTATRKLAGVGEELGTRGGALLFLAKELEALSGQVGDR